MHSPEGVPHVPSLDATQSDVEQQGEVDTALVGPTALEEKFEKDFTQHLEKTNRASAMRLSAIGASVGGALGVAASPLLLPGFAIAALVGGAGGYQCAVRWGRQELSKQGVASEGSVPEEAGMQRLSKRRLKYLVKWGHWQLLKYENAPVEWRCAVLDEVARAFSQWVQRVYLLRAGGRMAENAPEALEVYVHLAPLYQFLQRHASVEAVVQSAESLSRAFEQGDVDGTYADRCFTTFPTILETVSTLDRLSPALQAQLHKELVSAELGVLSVMRAQKRRRLQRIVDAIRKVMERPDVQKALSDRHSLEQRPKNEATSPTSSCSSGPQSPSQQSVKLVLPPEGAEDEHVEADIPADEEYYSVSDEELAASSSHHPGRSLSRNLSRSQATGSGSSGSAKLQERMQAFSPGAGDHCWSTFDASNFDVRSETYFRDRRKIPSSSALFELVNVDFLLIGESGPVWRVSDNADFYPAFMRRNGDNRFLFVQNYVFPPYQAILTGAVDPDAAWLRADCAQGRSWQRFLAADEEERRGLVKLIGSIEEGPWLAKRALPKKPVLLGKKVKMDSQYEPGKYIEIIFDIASGRAEQIATSIVCSSLRRLQLAVAVLIEGQCETELPENVLITGTMRNLDASKLFRPMGAHLGQSCTADAACQPRSEVSPCL